MTSTDAAWVPSLVTVERRGRVGLLTMNQPERLNPQSTFRGGSEQQIAEGLIELERDDEIRVIVFTGAGRSFSAGADIRPDPAQAELREASPKNPDRLLLRAIVEATDTDESRGWAMWYTFNRLSKPIVAAVHGWAVGGGAEMALWCDMIIADQTAKFSLPEVEMGLYPPFATILLARSIGRARAAELCFTGRPIEADEMKEWGIVNRIVPAGTDVDEALELAEQIAQYPLVALTATKRALMRAAVRTDEWEYNRRDFALCGHSQARSEATAEYNSKVFGGAGAPAR
jgi:enoyl-CoA hydratase